MRPGSRPWPMAGRGPKRPKATTQAAPHTIRVRWRSMEGGRRCGIFAAPSPGHRPGASMTRTPRIRPSWRELNGRWTGGWWMRRAVFISGMLGNALGGAHGQALESEVAYSARDSIRYDLRAQEVHLFGAATVTYQGVQLSAERIIFSFKNEEARAFGAPDSTGKVQGRPRFTQEDHAFDADSIRYNFRSKSGLIREVTTQEQETWVHAHLSKRHAGGEVHSMGGMLTTCDRPHPHYHFRVGRMM